MALVVAAIENKEGDGVYDRVATQPLRVSTAHLEVREEQGSLLRQSLELGRLARRKSGED